MGGAGFRGVEFQALRYLAGSGAGAGGPFNSSSSTASAHEVTFGRAAIFSVFGEALFGSARVGMEKVQTRRPSRTLPEPPSCLQSCRLVPSNQLVVVVAAVLRPLSV